MQHLARVGGGGDLQRQVLEDGADAADLLGIALGELALADINRIFEPDPDIATHDRAHGDERHLVPSGREDRPLILIAEELVGDAPHMGEVLGIGADPAKDAEDRLHEERRLDEAALEEVREVIEMADIVAFELEARTVSLSEFLKDEFDIL